MEFIDSMGRACQLEFDGYGDDIECISAEYIDTEGFTTMADNEVEWIMQEFAEAIWFHQMEKSIGHAESMCEGER